MNLQLVSALESRLVKLACHGECHVCKVYQPSSQRFPGSLQHLFDVVVEGVVSRHSLCRSDRGDVAGDDLCPGPLLAGKLRLFSIKSCLFCERVRLVLAHKKIYCEVVSLDPHEMPDWFLTKQPGGKLPCLEFPDGKILYGSIALCEYLDATYPENKLTPSNPFVNARHKMNLEDLFEEMYTHFNKSVYESRGEDKKALLRFFSCLLDLETELTEDFLGGYSLRMIDFMFWPILERLEMTENIFRTERPPLSQLSAYILRMKTVPAVSEVMLTTEDLVEHARQFIKRGKRMF